MYLWRKLATTNWLAAREDELTARFGQRLAIIANPPQRKVGVEIVCGGRAEARELVGKFGGKAEQIPRDWLKKFTRPPKLFVLRAGKRLVVTNTKQKPRGSASHIVIPAGLAFGTGEHATTAMSLRLLEEISRPLKGGWSVADLGTGSGILALAARRLGAGRVFAVDRDATAIATAKANARLNRVGKIGLREADARYWRPPGKVDVVVANLFSELLIATLPNLRRYLAGDARLVLSGILRSQEREILRALYANRFGVLEVRRRGRWIAILARGAP